MIISIKIKNNRAIVNGQNYTDDERMLIENFSFVLNEDFTYKLSEFITEVKKNFDNKKVLTLCNNVMIQNILKGV